MCNTCIIKAFSSKNLSEKAQNNKINSLEDDNNLLRAKLDKLEEAISFINKDK